MEDRAHDAEPWINHNKARSAGRSTRQNVKSKRKAMPFARLEFDGPVAKVVLNHPNGNRINFAMREELHDAFELIAASKARVVIVSGQGVDFCAGGDIREWPRISADALRPRVEVFANALDLLERLPIPTIAAVQGSCQGGGFELALACDLIIATRSARFAFPEASLEILTLQGGVVRVAERIGRSKAIELAFLCKPVSADRMAAWNVVNQVVADEDLYREADALANRLAAGPPGAYAATKVPARRVVSTRLAGH